MGIRDMMGKFKSGGDEYMELENEAEDTQPRQLLVEVEKLDSYTDSERLQRKVREGTVLLVKMKTLKTKDMEELKRAVDRVRKTCLAVNGDIAGLGEDWLVLTPAGAKIHREPEENL
ncbi:MAG: cell division protein SepF [Candidatus Aenigmarchaeota archaeon]|nr:cell division protein SepF [Candidatus Aenigmarchaeota archaeon]